jgi:predicted nucleic acid-binding protein
MAYLADTNVLLRAAQPGHPMHATARGAIASLLGRGEAIYLVPQNLVEFWVVATRPAERNGLGMPPADADLELARLEAQFPVLPETSDVYGRWRDLVARYGVSGFRAYDARLVASMLVYQIEHILSYNGDDFKHYREITVVDPATCK